MTGAGKWGETEKSLKRRRKARAKGQRSEKEMGGEGSEKHKSKGQEEVNLLEIRVVRAWGKERAQLYDWRGPHWEAQEA